MAESEEELKNLLTKVVEKSENVDLKLNIQKTKIMASSPITSWQIEGEKVKTVIDFTFLDSTITADGDCSHEIKTVAPWQESCNKSIQNTLYKIPGWVTHKLESRLPREITTTSDIQMIPV